MLIQSASKEKYKNDGVDEAAFIFDKCAWLVATSLILEPTVNATSTHLITRNKVTEAELRVELSSNHLFFISDANTSWIIEDTVRNLEFSRHTETLSVTFMLQGRQYQKTFYPYIQ